MPPPTDILSLIERFDRNRQAFLSGEYNETQLRREFLDPFFTALGWDVDNRQGFAEAYKDVIHEDAIKIGTATKAPDYSFRIGGVRKFFVEAKKPSVNVKDDINPAYQLRRYAWSAKLPLSVLTDFEELAVYDCRVRPLPTDKSSTSRTMYVQYTEYASKWYEIAGVFSKDAVLKGSFDRYAGTSKAKRGTAEVDDAFLNEIEGWRRTLATNIALRNPDLSQRELNFAVQRTIDRIIFLRICEDRGIETYGSLMALQNGERSYKRLTEMFHRADERYNSGLFHFRPEKERNEPPDEMTLQLEIDDKPLKDIVKSLYYPNSPYEFSVLPADILGQVYEQFLGKVIRLTPGHRAVVEDKPEVKKAGGVYYTPTYIVDYIVKNTVGRLLGNDLTPAEPKPLPFGEGTGVGSSDVPEMGSERTVKPKPPVTPKQISKLRILDPACGSGSFLIGAYQYLLDWHRDWYVNDGVENWTKGKNPTIYQGQGGDWRLTTSERKRILLNNIYGVDIDAQAVETTKLSLLLKVLEGENEQTISRQLRMFHERALPDLAANIKCGNSLIGPDFYDGRQLSLMDDDERMRINAFDWHAEFPQVFTRATNSPPSRGGAGTIGSGGFDVVIGNPPYVRQESLGETKAYFETHFKTYRSTADLYVSFIEKGMTLLKAAGLFGMIVSNKWLKAAYGDRLRDFLINQTSILQIVDLAGLPVFENATVRTLILLCTPQRKQISHLKYLSPPTMDQFRLIRTGDELRSLVAKAGEEIPIPNQSEDGWSLANKSSRSAIEHITKNTSPLKEYLRDGTYFGIKTGFNKAFVIDETIRKQLLATDKQSEEIIKPLVVGKDVRRYSLEFKERYLIWTYIGVPIKNYPAVFKHLKQFQPDLEKRWDQGNEWWELRACDYYDKFQKPKIIYPDISTTCRFTVDYDGYYSSNTTYFISGDDLYLLGLLNSSVGQFYFEEVCAGLEGRGTTYLRFFGQYLEGFPVRTINFSDPADKSRHDRMVGMVQQMLDLNKNLVAAKTAHEQTALQRQIGATDRQIDELVYELYGLTEEERRIVERGRVGRGFE